jgi:DNA-binding transcriptional MerR regulator
VTDSLTPSQTARRLGISKARVLQLNNQGLLPALRTPLGRLFDPKDVERFARERAAAARDAHTERS